MVALYPRLLKMDMVVVVRRSKLNLSLNRRRRNTVGVVVLFNSAAVKLSLRSVTRLEALVYYSLCELCAWTTVG